MFDTNVAYGIPPNGTPAITILSKVLIELTILLKLYEMSDKSFGYDVSFLKSK